MGLDTSHNAWSGSYSSFNSWRSWLAGRKGFVLREMVGFGGTTEWTEEMINDPLYPLLSHSDCDGELTPEECAKVADGLTEIIRTTIDPESWYIEAATQFRDGCLLASEKNETIDFH